MYRFKRLLVGLSMRQQNENLVRYAGLVARLARSEKVFLLHVAGALSIPEAIRREYPELLRPLGEFAEQKIGEMVDAHFDGHPDTQVVSEVLEGPRLERLLEFSLVNEVDLIVTGKKNHEGIGGNFSEKIVRKAPCSVLVLPEGSPAQITRVLVPVDFSEYSAHAVETGAAFAAAAGLGEITCLHVYKVPSGFYETGRSFEQFAEIMQQNAEISFQRFIGGIDLKGLSAIPLFALNRNSAAAIQETAQRDRFDLLVVGTRGRGTGAAALMGSVTERLLWTTEVPLLAVKKKGANMNLLKALLEAARLGTG